jgi:hypothetical protein
MDNCMGGFEWWIPSADQTPFGGKGVRIRIVDRSSLATKRHHPTLYWGNE